MKSKCKVFPNGKIKEATLTHMREVAYGNKTCMEIHHILEHAERMRNDDGLLSSAEEKRNRKNLKRAQGAA